MCIRDRDNVTAIADFPVRGTDSVVVVTDGVVLPEYEEVTASDVPGTAVLAPTDVVMSAAARLKAVVPGCCWSVLNSGETTGD